MKKPTKRHAAFVSALSELQDGLGELNDIAAGHELLHDLTDNELIARSAVFAAGMTANIEALSAKLLKTARHAHTKLIDTRATGRACSMSAVTLRSFYHLRTRVAG